MRARGEASAARSHAQHKENCVALAGRGTRRSCNQGGRSLPSKQNSCRDAATHPLSFPLDPLLLEQIRQLPLARPPGRAPVLAGVEQRLGAHRAARAGLGARGALARRFARRARGVERVGGRHFRVQLGVPERGRGVGCGAGRGDLGAPSPLSSFSRLHVRRSSHTGRAGQPAYNMPFTRAKYPHRTPGRSKLVD